MADRKDRRDFLKGLGIGAGVVALGGQAVAALRSLVPLEEIELPEAERRALVEAAGAGDLPLSAMIKDDTRCIRCGLCAIRCPTDAMTMERFQIQERWAPSSEAPTHPEENA